jgi:hypothetical protein
MPIALLILTIATVGPACLLATRVGPVVPFAFVAAYVLVVGAITFINIDVVVHPEWRQSWVGSWLEVWWPLWTVFFTPSAISALLACWFSRPLTRRDATALLGVYLLLILVMVGAAWALDLYDGEQGFRFLIGQFAVLSTIFFATAYRKRVAMREQHDLPALRGNSDR